MKQIKIYCPSCKSELPQVDTPFNYDSHPLEGYRIDCECCGLNAWVEDVSVKEAQNKELLKLLSDYIEKNRTTENFQFDVKMNGYFTSEKIAKIVLKALGGGSEND